MMRYTGTLLLELKYIKGFIPREGSPMEQYQNWQSRRPPGSGMVSEAQLCAMLPGLWKTQFWVAFHRGSVQGHTSANCLTFSRMGPHKDCGRIILKHVYLGAKKMCTHALLLYNIIFSLNFFWWSLACMHLKVVLYQNKHTFKFYFLSSFQTSYVLILETTDLLRRMLFPFSKGENWGSQRQINIYRYTQLMLWTQSWN